jgi:hypothetical protein
MMAMLIITMLLAAPPEAPPAAFVPVVTADALPPASIESVPVEMLPAAPAIPPAGGSFLAVPRYEIDEEVCGPFAEYCPQPGDIMLATDTSVFWKVMHNLAGTGHPTHSGIVFRRPDGTMAILEGGPQDTLLCRTVDWLPNLRQYEQKGRAWVRRRAVPLTAEESCRLTTFALENDGKIFALARLGVQLTPFRTRGPVKTTFVGKPHGDRYSYFCSELVCEACVAAGLLDAQTTRPTATYPRDLFLDRSLNPHLNRHLKLAPAWDPPARWVSWPEESHSAQ